MCTETILILLAAEVVPALGTEFPPDPGVLVDELSRPQPSIRIWRGWDLMITNYLSMVVASSGISLYACITLSSPETRLDKLLF